MHGSGHTLIPVVGFSRSRGEGSVLQEEGLIPGKSMFQEVGLPSFIVTPQTVLVEDGVEFALRLRGDVIIQVFVPVGDVFPEIHLSWVNPALKYLLPVISQHTAFVVRLQDGEEEHVLNVGGGHYPSTLAHRTVRLYPDLLLYLGADDGFGLMGVERVTGAGHISMQPGPEEFFDDRDWAVIRLGDVPQVGKSLGVAVSIVPRTRERQLTILVNNFVVFNDQGNSPEVQLVIQGDYVVLRLARLVLIPLSLAGNVSHLVCRQGRSLG